MLKDKKTRLSFILSLLFSFILITLYFKSKSTFTMDESFSFSLANFFKAPIPGWITFDSNVELSKELMNGYTITDDAFNFKGVYYNLCGDNHPTLYFYALHFISSIFKGRFTIWFSYILNAPLFLINCFLLMKIIKEETNSNLLMILVNLFYSLNKVFLYHFQLIRMYQMVSTLTLLFVYFGIKILKQKGNQYLNYLFLLIFTILGGLTHYYFYVALGCIALFMAIYLIINKRIKDLLLSFLSCLTGVLLNIFVLFKGTIKHFTYGHGASSISKLENGLFDKEAIKSFIEQSWGGTIIFYLSIIVLIISIIMLIKKRKEFILPSILLSSYFLYFYFVANLATYKIERYMLPIDALSLLGLFLGIIYILKDKKIIVVLIISLIILNLDMSWITKINNKKSWDVAKEHQWDKALVITSENNNYYNYINSFLWMDLRWYNAVYTSSNIANISNELMSEEFVLYIEKSLDQNKIIEKVRNELPSGSDYKIVEAHNEVEITSYNMYILHG